MNKAQAGRQEYWKRVIAEQEKSGQSVRAYCRERGVGEHSLYMWRQRFSREMPVSFALVEAKRAAAPPTAPPAAPPAALELMLTSGDLLRIPADSNTLRLVLGALREQL